MQDPIRETILDGVKMPGLNDHTISHVSDSSKTKRSIAQQAPRKGQVFESTPLAITMPESPKGLVDS